MLPENASPTSETGIILREESKVMETLIGGDATIVPRMRGKNIEGYDVALIKEGGKEVKFSLSKQQGDDLISARLSALTEGIVDIGQEAFDALVPTYVAVEYKKRLIALGTPEEDIPSTTSEMIQRAKEELIEYRELGKEQIASAAQAVADEIIQITYEVFKGNKVRYNGLPKDFQQVIKFQLPSISALASQHAGISEETMDAQRRVLALNLMSQEKTRDAILEWLPAMAGAGADTIGTFFGKLIGTTSGATAGAFLEAKSAIQNRKKSK